MRGELSVCLSCTPTPVYHGGQLGKTGGDRSYTGLGLALSMASINMASAGCCSSAGFLLHTYMASGRVWLGGQVVKART